jgi:hypothetical protein
MYVCMYVCIQHLLVMTEPLEGLLQEWAKYADEEVSMYVCMCVCIYVYMYIYIYIYNIC